MIEKSELEEREKLFEEYRRLTALVKSTEQELYNIRSQRNTVKRLIDIMIDEDIGPVEAKLKHNETLLKRNAPSPGYAEDCEAYESNG